MRHTIAVAALCLCALICGCSASKDIAKASDAVTQFHTQLNRGDFASIYSHADPRLREVSKQQDFLNLMAAIHRKLGQVQDATRKGFFVNYNTSGSEIRLTYATKFTGGEAEEQFTWAKSGEGVQLLGYHINSDALILK